MIEVTLRIRFTQHCLGAYQPRVDSRRGAFCMIRDTEGTVMFPPTWWKAIAAYGAQVTNRSVELVNRVDWSIAVEGMTSLWRRYLPADPSRPPSERRRYALHEAFLRGDVIAVSCVLPDGLAEADFRAIMDVAGRYKGISPFKPGTFGTFAVVDVGPRAGPPPPA